jgi:hypothetical protein
MVGGRGRHRERDVIEDAARQAAEGGSQTSGLPSEAGLAPSAGNTPDSTTRVDTSGMDHDDVPAHPSLGAPPRRERISPITEESTMPQQSWSAKRERQYEHIKEGLLERGRDEDTASEIAARTTNKGRARAGETRTASRTSIDDISSGRRGGLRSHRGSGGRTVAQLRNEARSGGVRGYSRMRKAELERRLGR